MLAFAFESISSFESFLNRFIRLFLLVTCKRKALVDSIQKEFYELRGIL